VRDEIVLLAPPDVLAMIPDAWYEPVQLDVMQRTVVIRDGRPVKFLRPGVYRIWQYRCVEHGAEPLCSCPAAPLAQPRKQCCEPRRVQVCELSPALLGELDS
jgi:hypothetical protein